MKRSANAVWNGGLKDGQGVFSVGGNAPGRPPSPTVLCGRLRRAWPELACACCGRRPDSNLPRAAGRIPPASAMVERVYHLARWKYGVRHVDT